MYRSLRGLGAEASLSFNVGPSTFGASSGSSGGYKTMDICANKGGTKFMSYNNVGGWSATCNNGQSCQKTSSITDPVCTSGASGSAPPPPPPPPSTTFFGFFPKTSAATAALMAKPGSTAIKIGSTPTNRPAASKTSAPTLTYFPATTAKSPAPATLTYRPGPTLYRMPGGALVDVSPGTTPGGGGVEEDKTKTYLVIGLGLLLVGGVGVYAYQNSK